VKSLSALLSISFMLITGIAFGGDAVYYVQDSGTVYVVSDRALTDDAAIRKGQDDCEQAGNNRRHCILLASRNGNSFVAVSRTLFDNGGRFWMFTAGRGGDKGSAEKMAMANCEDIRTDSPGNTRYYDACEVVSVYQPKADAVKATVRGFFGSVAVNNSTGAYGVVTNSISTEEADRSAIKACGEGCSLVVSFGTGECVQVSNSGDNRTFGFGVASTQLEAKRLAFKECYARGGTHCYSRAWGCNRKE